MKYLDNNGTWHTIDLEDATIEELQEAQERLAEKRSYIKLQINKLKSDRRNFGILIADDLLKAGKANTVVGNQQRKINRALRKASQRRKVNRRNRALVFESAFVETAREELTAEIFVMLCGKARNKASRLGLLDKAGSE